MQSPVGAFWIFLIFMIDLLFLLERIKKQTLRLEKPFSTQRRTCLPLCTGTDRGGIA